MVTHSKYIFQILVAVFCIACSKQAYYEDECVRFDLPEGVVADTITNQVFKTYNYEKDGEFRILVSEIPIGIVPSNAHYIANLLECPWIEESQPEPEEINGYPVTVYKNTMTGNYNIFVRTFIFSNGDKSVVLMESHKGDSTTWHVKNLKWKIPKRTVLSLEERTKKFEDFLTALVGGSIKMQITADGNNVNIKLYAESWPSDMIPNEIEIKQEIRQLINCFDVFTEYGAKKCDFSIIIEDQSCAELRNINIPYSQYRQIDE